MRNTKFINDRIVKKILTSEDNENKEYLIRIISGVTGIDKLLLRDNIKLITSEIGNNINTVNSVVDAIFCDSGNYINIEINYKYNRNTIVKNNVYLYHMVLRQIKTYKDYKNVLPSIQININGFDLFGENEFIYKSQMVDRKYNKLRDEMLTIYDINLEYLRNMDYNKIKKGYVSDLEKILYVFVCDDRFLLDDIYNGDEVMDKVMEDFDRITWERDSVLFYDPDELERQAIDEKVQEEVKLRIDKEVKLRLDKEVKLRIDKEVKLRIDKEKKEQIKKMIRNNIDDELILNCFEIDEKVLLDIKKEL